MYTSILWLSILECFSRTFIAFHAHDFSCSYVFLLRSKHGKRLLTDSSTFEIFISLPL